MTGRSEGMFTRFKLSSLGFIGDDTLSFNDGQQLIGRVYVRFRACSVFEEDCDYLKILTLIPSHEMMHVYLAFEVFRIGGTGL
jgi:hypothetical protein